VRLWPKRKKAEPKPAEPKPAEPKPAEPITLDEAIKRGIVPKPQPAPIKGLKVVDYEAREERYYPSWRGFRDHFTAIYLGGESKLGFRDAPSGIRQPVLDIGPTSTDTAQRIARGAAIDAGIATPTITAEALLRLKGSKAQSHG
jgi:hypothetical protein